MPIRDSQKRRYPPDWPRISDSIRWDRAAGRCECVGLCGVDHHGRCPRVHGGPSENGGQVVLTVAHLNHTPEDCRDDNLRAFCQACHLRYDTRHHASNAARTRQAKQTAGMEPLFEPGGA